MATLVIKPLPRIEPEALYPLASQWHEGMGYARYAELLAQMEQLGYRIIVAMLGETIVGMTGLWEGCKFYCGRYLEVDNFVVDRAHRGQGIGRKLMDYVTELARKENFDTVTLNVYITNDEANRIYDKQGFTKIGYHRFLLLDPDADSTPLHVRLKAMQAA